MTIDTALQEHIDTAYSIDAFSKETLAELDKREKAVRIALSGIDKNMEKVAFNLYWIYSNKAYRAMGFQSITDYALNKFELGKTNTYSFISIVESFAAHSEDGSIADKFDNKYKGYSISKLSLLVGLTDKQIEELEINPSMSVRDIKKLLKKADREEVVASSDKKELPEKTGDASSDAQGTMIIKDNAVSIPESEPDAEENADDVAEMADDEISGYSSNTVYEFSVQDDERTILKEIKSILKENKAEHEESFFSLICRYPVRKGEKDKCP